MADAPANSSNGPATGGYVVLARKYRPENFDDLIGQEAMVRTLRNAFATDRIAQGYMLTGVRGVGKTTTARILARALNYEKLGQPGKPTVVFDGYGAHCHDIVRGRHPDVIEMDAASNTGVDDVREIIENARYRPIVARYKVFIIDEVHMLSKSAFNALLKTLEEPPEHVKFVFATTEIRKVPVTVLSRCQTFSLRRIDVPALVSHFARIAEAEGVTCETEALALIARAAEGSVRDGLSILDQAIAMGAGRVDVASVRAMLGLADRGRIFDLLERVLAGRTAEALAALEALHSDGAEPVQTLSDMAETVHIVTRAKVAGAERAGEALPPEERRRAAELSGRLSMALLARAWGMLLKGVEETTRAGNPRAAAEMVVIRMAHVADLPTPDEAIRMLGGERALPAEARGARERAPPPVTTPAGPLNEAPRDRIGPVETMAAGPPVDPDDPGPFADSDEDPVDEVATARSAMASMPRSFAEMLDLVGRRRDARLKLMLEDQTSLVRFEPGRVEIFLLPGAPPSLANELSEKLGRWTGRRWVVALSRDKGERPVGEVRRERQAEELAELREHPAVRAVLETFPGSDIAAVRTILAPDETDETYTDTDDSAAG